MNHYLIIVTYDGSAFSGWQRLKDNSNTIQQTLESMLSDYTRENIRIHGSGRTDAGVNAYRQYADFFCQSDLNTILSGGNSELICELLNQKLPDGLRILTLQKIAQEFHSRKSCISKTYQYRLSLNTKSDVFTRKYCYQPYDPAYPDTDLLTNEGQLKSPDLAAMKIAASYLIGTHDFSAFTTDKTPEKSHVRTITSIEIKPVTLISGQKILLMQFTGNGFLYHMVRILAGTLLETGYHKRSAHTIPDILKAGVRKNAGPTLPAHALFLYDVQYEDKYNITSLYNDTFD